METRFSPKPYQVTYTDFHTGKIKKIVRRPPPLMHNMLPEDIVSLTTTANADWKKDDEAVVKSINSRNPNVLQVEKSSGETNFFNASELLLKEKVNEGDVKRIDSPMKNRYLRWP